MRSAAKLAEERSARRRERAQFLETLKEAYSSSDSALRELGSIHQAELDVLNAEHTKEREAMEEKLKALALADADARSTAALEIVETNLRVKHELALKTATAQHDAEVKALRATLAEAHAQSRDAASEEARRTAAAHAAELEAKSQQGIALEARVTELSRMLSLQGAPMTVLEAELKAATDKASALQKQLENNDKDFERVLKEERAAAAAEQQRLMAEIKAEWKARDEADLHRVDLTRATAQLADELIAHKERRAEAEAAYDAIRADMQAQIERANTAEAALAAHKDEDKRSCTAAIETVTSELVRQRSEGVQQLLQAQTERANGAESALVAHNDDALSVAAAVANTIASHPARIRTQSVTIKGTVLGIKALVVATEHHKKATGCGLIVDVNPSGALAKAGIKSGVGLVSINGQDTRAMDKPAVKALAKAATSKGFDVALVVAHPTYDSDDDSDDESDDEEEEAKKRAAATT